MRIFLFWDILDSGMFNLLDKKFTARKRYSDGQEQEMEKLWLKLYDQFFVYVNDPEARKVLKLRMQEEHLKHQIQSLFTLIEEINFYLESDIISKDVEKEIYSTLLSVVPKARINKFNSIASNVKTIQSIYDSLTTQYRLTTDKKKKQAKKVLRNPYDNFVTIERTLNVVIVNPQDVTVMRYLAYLSKMKSLKKAS